MHNRPLSFDDNTPLPYVTGMPYKFALALAALSLYVTSAEAATSSAYRASCTRWLTTGEQMPAQPCDVSVGIAGASGALLVYTITPPEGPELEIEISEWACRINGDACEQRPAYRRNHIRVNRLKGGAIEFTAPPAGSL